MRAFLAVGGNPPFIASGSGARLRDVDGREYLDFVGTWGPAILGHAHPDVVEAVCKAAAQGLSFGAPTAGEVEFAQNITRIYPSIEMLRCVSSGTEATMSALRLAKGATHRNLLVKFEGGYHGHSDPFLVRAGSGAATFGTPDSAGVGEAVAHDTLTLPYNDVSVLERVFADRGSEIAAVIVEPVAGNMGCVPPQPGFLPAIIEGCQRHGIVSIFDEVMTGCRVALGGAQERYGLRADLTCLGKVVGGGMPLAVYGGRRDLMRLVAPLGPVYQAGTLSGNPLAIAAGLATLKNLEPASYTYLEERGAQMEAGCRAALARRKVPGQVQRVGSMLTIFFSEERIVDFASALRVDRDRFARFHRRLTSLGVYWPPSPLEASFISLAHTTQDIEQAIIAVDAALTD